MKKKQPKPTKHRSVVFNQLCKLIPVGMVGSLAKEYGVDKKSRTFSPWSQRLKKTQKMTWEELSGASNR